MSEIVVLAFDLGASSCRAMIGFVDEKEKKVRVEELYRWPNYMVRIGDSLYWDVLRIWHEMKQAIKLAYKKYGNKLVSIGVDTWGIDFALLDEKGELLSNPHTYRDPRTEGIMEEVLRIIPREKLYERTGIQFWRINTLFQLYSMVKRRDPILRIAKTFLMVPDLFNYWLSGTIAAEFTEATTTQFLDPRVKNWAYDVLEALGIPTHIFPPVIEPTTKLGKIHPKVVVELDISRDIEVIAPATHDTASAIAAAPMVDENAGYVSSGTWSLVGIELPEPLINRKAMEYNYTNEGGAFNTITFLRNIQGMWLVEECRRVLAEKGIQLTYDEILKMASEAKPFKAFIDPDDDRFVAPLNMVEAINSFLEETKQEKPSGIGELFRVIFESLALKYRLVFEQAEDLIGRKLTHINIFGGGSRNWFLNQLTADFTNKVVYAGPEEATSIGNVLLQVAGLGIIKSLKELREYVRNSYKITMFEPKHTKEHDDAYNKFLDIISRRTL
ncbi:MAG: rhamnulokinase [Desulfurococcaceae archaeon]|jgi:sugar (pentulose or hexulose) kinase|nr:rhamnulokinase [Desulfurococcaceae archaeon]